MVAFDDSIEKLQEFNGALTVANDHLQQGLQTLEAHGERADEARQDVDEDLAGLNDVLEEFAQELEKAQQAAVDALDEVSAAAEEQEQKLGQIEQRTEAEQAELERTVAEDEAELDKGFGELSDGAFEPLAETATTLGGETERLRIEAEADFAALDTALEEARTEIEAERTPTTGALEQAEDEAEQDAQELETDGAARASEATSASDDLEAQCTESGDALEQAYDEWTEEVEEQEKQVGDGLRDLVAEAAAQVEQEHGQALSDAVDQTVQTALGGLQQQLDDTDAAAEAGEQVTTELEPLLADLEVAQRKAEEIDELIDNLDSQ